MYKNNKLFYFSTAQIPSNGASRVIAPTGTEACDSSLQQYTCSNFDDEIGTLRGVGSADDCRRLCDSHTECKLFTYFTNNHCLLFKDCSMPSTVCANKKNIVKCHTGRKCSQPSAPSSSSSNNNRSMLHRITRQTR